MRRVAVVGALAAAAALLAQPSSSYHVTHTYLLGGEGSWDYVIPDPPNHRLFIARQTRLMVVDEDTGDLLGEVTGINGAHGTAVASLHGPWFRDLGQRPVRGDVRPEDFQGARQDSGRRRRRRYPLRQRLKPRLHVEWRRALLDGDRPPRGDLITNLPLGGKPENGARPATARYTRTSPIPARWWRSTRRPLPLRGAGPPPRASSLFPWPSIRRTTGSSADAAAA